MRRIGRNATAKLDAATVPVPPLEAKPVIPPGGTPLHCGKWIFNHLDDWLEHCGKRKHSFRGCSCAPVKPAASPSEPDTSQVRISFGGSS